MACYSSKSQDLYTDDIDGNPVTELFTIGLTADPSMANGEYEVRIIEVKFVLAAGGASVPLRPVTTTRHATGGGVGVNPTRSIPRPGGGAPPRPLNPDLGLRPIPHALPAARRDRAAQAEPVTAFQR